MKNLFSCYLIFGLISLGLLSCSNEEDVINSTSVKSVEHFTLHAKYKGKKYTVPCVIENDTVIKFLDVEFNELYQNEIALLPDLAILANNSEYVEFYSNSKELLEENNLRILDLNGSNGNNSLTKATGDLAGRAIIWDDNNYSDRSLTIDINYDLQWTWPHLKTTYGFNDKTSSIKVWNFIPNDAIVPDPLNSSILHKGSNLRTVFIGYENDSFVGRALYCVASNSAVHADPNLKYIPCGSGDWNDRITSAVFRIALYNVFTPHPSL